MLLKTVVVAIAAATVAACTTTAATPQDAHYWQAGDNVSDTFEQDLAKCKLVVDERYRTDEEMLGALLYPAQMESTFGTCLQALGC